MIIQQLNRTDPETILINVKNVDGGGSITTGMGVALVATTASGDGIGAVRATAALSAQFSGIAKSDIAINAYGLAVLWGFAASVAISQSVGSWTITAGDTLQLSGAAGQFTSVITPQAVSTQMYKYVIALGALADTISNPRSYMSGLVRAI
jgi:hypothetical protein